MTLGELENYLDSYARRKTLEQKEKAKFDYQLANLIGISVARIYNKSVEYPEIQQIYPKLFEEEVKQNNDELTIMRFMQFAQQHNQKFREVKE